MKPYPCKLILVGTSTAFTIPAEIARFYTMKAGDELLVRYAENVPRVRRRIIATSGGKSVAVIVPVALRKHFGWAIGDTVEIPFHEWINPPRRRRKK